MMSKKYKVGDKVKRVSYNHGRSGVEIGMIETIEQIATDGDICLDKYNWWSDGYVRRNFELVPNKNLIGGKLL